MFKKFILLLFWLSIATGEPDLEEEWEPETGPLQAPPAPPPPAPPPPIKGQTYNCEPSYCQSIRKTAPPCRKVKCEFVNGHLHNSAQSQQTLHDPNHAKICTFVQLDDPSVCDGDGPGRINAQSPLLPTTDTSVCAPVAYSETQNICLRYCEYHASYTNPSTASTKYWYSKWRAYECWVGPGWRQICGCSLQMNKGGSHHG